MLASFYILIEAKDSTISFLADSRKSILQAIDASARMSINHC
jgi:hypothetical protein